MAVLEDIVYSNPNKNPTIDSDESFYSLPFYKDEEYFSVLENYVTFIKSVETLVRNSKYYKRYIAYIKTDVGLNFCQVLSNIDEQDESDDLLEMHHGPILTLFDYVSIVIDDLLYRKKPINTFIVADIIIKEHMENNVQVVMLTETVHQLYHATGKPFINVRQAFGDLNRFLTKYKYGLQPDQINKINRYIASSMKYDSFDGGLLKLKENIQKWGYTEVY